MRTALALALTAALAAAPASAQEANQVNTAETPATAVAGPETTLGNAAEPALPATTDTPAEEIPLEPVEMPTTQVGGGDGDDGFPWGLIGLVGLIGLLGRVRS